VTPGHDLENSSILTLNAGPSSLKFALFESGRDGRRLFQGAVEAIGQPSAHFWMHNARQTVETNQKGKFNSHTKAMTRIVAAVREIQGAPGLAAVGHRIAHGGPECDCPKRVTPALLGRMKRLVHLAPLHLPASIEGIEAVSDIRSDLPQVVCFDTSFHHDLPRLAQMTGLPRRFERDGLRRYGYHGLSYEFIVRALRNEGVNVDRERIIVAHLGSGASLAAIRGGRSIETTMGFSTLSGVPMAARSGTIDPGLLLYLQRRKEMTAEDVERLLFTGSGLLGLSEISGDMRVLLERPEETAAEAIDFFCYHVRRELVGLTATLGGLDRVVFTGGIGANLAQARARLCAGLGYLGIALDSGANARGETRISTPRSRVVVEARQTNEAAMIASHVRDIIVGNHDRNRQEAS
jgi:acetate kinase